MNVFDNIASGRYENLVPYRGEQEAIDKETMTGLQVREATARNTVARHNQATLHREEEGRLTALLKADLETEYGVSGHPKADKLFSIAWDRGHSGGYSDIANSYSELVELITP